MALTPQSFSVYTGEDISLTVTMSPATAITGWSLVFTVRDKLGGTVLLSKTSGAGQITTTDAANGVFVVALTSANTLALAEGAYPFDVQRSDVGSKRVLAIGTLNVLPEVTQ